MNNIVHNIGDENKLQKIFFFLRKIVDNENKMV